MRFNAVLTLALAGLAAALPISEPKDANSKSPYPKDDPYYGYCQAEYPTDYEPLSGHELLKVSLFIRHGDRTSIYNLPHDRQVWNLCNQRFDTTVYYNTTNVSNGDNSTVAIQEHIDRPTRNGTYHYAMSPGNCVTGQLTDKGKWQHRNLGEVLRTAYIDKIKFLPENLDASQMSVSSTDVWRTRQSAHSLLSGLYPNGSRVDAVDIHTLPFEVHNLSGNNIACPVIDKYEELAAKEPGFKDPYDAAKPRMNYLNELLGTNNIPKYNKRWSVLNDIFWTRLCHGMPLPCSPHNESLCVTQEDADLAMKMATMEYSYIRRDSANHVNFDRASLGSFMNELTAELEVPTIPLTFYSAHDDTLATLLGILQATDFPWPPYASDMLFEVWQSVGDNPEKVVRVLFNGKVVVPKDGVPCKDLSACPLDKFVGYLRNFIPEKLEEFCEYHPNHPKEE